MVYVCFGLLAGWSPASNTAGREWIQADLLATYELFNVTTQGRGDFDDGVSSYYISYGDDGETWVDIPELYQANRDAHTKVTNQLPANTIARFIRLRPQAHSSFRGMGLRWDVTGKEVGMFNVLSWYVLLQTCSDEFEKANNNCTNQKRKNTQLKI